MHSGTVTFTEWICILDNMISKLDQCENEEFVEAIELTLDRVEALEALEIFAKLFLEESTEHVEEFDIVRFERLIELNVSIWNEKKNDLDFDQDLDIHGFNFNVHF